VAVTATDANNLALPIGTTDGQGQLQVATLREGDYTLDLSLADHRAQTVKVSLVEGRQMEAKKFLEPLPGRLKVGGRSELEVYESGRRLGKANEWIELAAGKHELELRCKGFRAEGMTVTIPPNKHIQQEEPALVTESGTIRIIAASTLPADNYLARQKVQVRVDGGK
jgi:hypothetical protein